MAKVHHVKKARKTKRKHGIVKGQPYWWLKRRAPGQREGRKVYFTKPPRPSQVEGNPFLAAVLALQEGIDDAGEEGLADAMRQAASEMWQLADEQDEKADNMPDALQDSETAQMLRDRAESCREIAEELEQAADEVEALLSENCEPEDGAEGDNRDPKEIAGAVSWDIE